MIKITRSIFAGAGLVALAVSSAYGVEKITVSHGYPPAHSIVAEGIEPWMECVREKTGGTLDFNYYPSGQIASTKGSLDALNSGLVHVSTTAIGYLTDKMPLSGIAMLPNMGDSSVEGVKAFRNLLENDSPIAKEFANNGVKPLFVNVLPPYQVLSAKGRIDSLDAFKGRVLRSGGGAMSLVINELQASPAEMNGGDSYVAMQRGTLDAAILSLLSVKPYSLEELVNAISTNANLGTFPTIMVMDSKKFDSLDSSAQDAVVSCGLEVENYHAEYLDNQSKENSEEFAAMGIEMYEFSEENWREVSERLDKVSQNYVQRLERRGLPAGEVYQAYREQLDK